MRSINTLHIVNCHTEGVTADVLVGGLPKIPGSTMIEKKAFFNEHLDHLRTLVVNEPRGRAMQCVNMIVESTDPRAEFGVLICEPEEIVDMSGSNTIGVATVLLETGMVPMTGPLTTFALDMPAGLIEVSAHCRDGKVVSVTFTNQPAFVGARDGKIDVPGLGELRVDVAWGGMWYAIVDASDVDLELVPARHDDIVQLGERIKLAVREQLPIVHPDDPALGRPEVGGAQCTLFADPVVRTAEDRLESRNAVVVSPGAIDRSACGTGTSARLALLSARGEIDMHEKFVHRSIIGTEFIGEIVATSRENDIPRVTPTITGRAWITGTQQVTLDATDPFPAGFSMR